MKKTFATNFLVQRPVHIVAQQAVHEMCCESSAIDRWMNEGGALDCQKSYYTSLGAGTPRQGSCLSPVSIVRATQCYAC